MSLIGCVKFFSAKRGFGFVTVLTQDHERSNTDLFVHFSNLNVRNNEFKRLFPGEYVSFSYGKGMGRDGRDICIDVTGVLGGPLLTEHAEHRYRYFPKDSQQQQPRQQKQQQHQKRQQEQEQEQQEQEQDHEEAPAEQEEAPAEQEEAEEDENDPEA
jgi:cold shock CspA family protein